MASQLLRLFSSASISAIPRRLNHQGPKLAPLFDRILVKRHESETQTKGGIMLPETAQSKTQTGTVVAVGVGARTKRGDFLKPIVQVGDKVLLPEYGGNKIDIEGETHHIYRESDIIGRWTS